MTKGPGDRAVDWSKLSVAALKAKAKAMKCVPDQGSGKGGRVVKADLVAALERAQADSGTQPWNRNSAKRKAKAKADQVEPSNVITPKQFDKRRKEAADQAKAAKAAKAEADDALVKAMGRVDLGEVEQAVGLARVDIIERLVGDGWPLDRARQFTDLWLEYAACSVAIDRAGPVVAGEESPWATRRDKVRKALGEYRAHPSDWLWSLL